MNVTGGSPLAFAWILTVPAVVPVVKLVEASPEPVVTLVAGSRVPPPLTTVQVIVWFSNGWPNCVVTVTDKLTGSVVLVGAVWFCPDTMTIAAGEAGSTFNEHPEKATATMTTAIFRLTRNRHFTARMEVSSSVNSVTMTWKKKNSCANKFSRVPSDGSR